MGMVDIGQQQRGRGNICFDDRWTIGSVVSSVKFKSPIVLSASMISLEYRSFWISDFNLKRNTSDLKKNNNIRFFFPYVFLVVFSVNILFFFLFLLYSPHLPFLKFLFQHVTSFLFNYKKLKHFFSLCLSSYLS